MFSEKTSLIEKKGSPFYGSYKETNNVLEEIHWQNKKKSRQLFIVTTVIVILTLLAIGITLAITLPPLLERNANRRLDPANPLELSINSTSVLEHYGKAGIASDNTICSDIGKNILENMNGSVVDSAIAVALCLGVVAPQSCGLGGGMFLSVYSNRTMYTLNARETAPKNISAEEYANNPLASKGALGVGIPSELAGLWTAHQKFGITPWSDLVKPAKDLALSGFTVSSHLAKQFKKYYQKISADPVLKSEFINPISGQPWIEGDVITRPRLARTLETLETEGVSGFYNGTLSTQILQELTEHGSNIMADDLSGYSAEWVNPIVLKLKNNFTMFSLPFPSSGPVIALSLAILDGYGKLPTAPTQIENGIHHHRLIETLKFAETHRAQISDPNFDTTGKVDELVNKMLSTEYADELRAKIKDYSISLDPSYYGAVYASTKDSGTAHISIIGPNGDAVSLTTTVNAGFGAGFMGNLTGIIFNNELDDFSFPNNTEGLYGLPINPANSIEPGKRPASSISPVILINSSGQPVLATGGSGGKEIVVAVVSATWRALYENSDIKAAIDYPRYSIRFNTTTEVLYEYGLPAYIINDLERKGHRTQRLPLEKHIASVNSVCMTRQTQEILANADYRKGGSGSSGF